MSAATVGRIDLYIPLVGIDRERMVGPVSRGLTYPKSIDVRTFADPLAGRNLANAIPVTDRKHPANVKHAAASTIAPKGWRLASGPCRDCLATVARLLSTSGPSAAELRAAAPGNLNAAERAVTRYQDIGAPIAVAETIAAETIAAETIAAETIAEPDPAEILSASNHNLYRHSGDWATCYIGGCHPVTAAEPIAAGEATAPEPIAAPARSWRGPSVESVKTVLAAAMPVQDAPSAAESAPEPTGTTVAAEPAPMLRILPAAPSSPAAGRPSCPRCGQTFRRSGIGLAWHVANWPDCAELGRSAAAL